jgi:hypothetical protein
MADLITIDDYKLYKGLVKTNEDEKLEALAAQVSALIKTYCGRTFIDHYVDPKTEYFNCNRGDRTLLLKEWPLVEIVSVETRDTESDSYTATSDYIIRYDSDYLVKKVGSWPEGYNSVKVVYKGGYAEVPADLKLAAMDLLHFYAKEEYKGQQTLMGASKEGVMVMGSSKLPGHILQVLNMHKNG